MNNSSKSKKKEDMQARARMLVEIVHAMIDAVLVLDLEGTCIFANRQYAQMFGLKQEDFLGKSVMDFSGIEYQKPEEIEKFMLLIGEAIEKGRAGPADLIIVASDGRQVPVSVADSTINDAKGAPTHVIAVVRDITERKKMEEELIKHRNRLEELVKERTAELTRKNEQLLAEITERKQAEEALRESEEKFRNIAERSFDGIFEMDLEGHITYASPAIEQITGYKPEEIVGSSFLNYVSESTAHTAFQWLAKLVEGENVKELQMEMTRKDGSSAIVEINASPIFKDGSAIEVQGTVRDITDRKRAEEALREKEARYRELADSITDVFFAFDNDLRYTYWNKASEELTGTTEKEAIGKSLYDIFPDIQQTRRVEKVYLDVLRRRQPRTFVIKYSIEGRDHYFEISVYPSKGGISVFTKDITERKKTEEKLKEYSEKLKKKVEERTRELQDAQEKLIRKEKLAMLGQLAGSVGHEIRNPLGTISNSVYFLKMKLKDADEKVLKHVAVIDRNVQRANRIITDLLDSSRVRPPSLIESSVNDIVKDTLESIEMPATISVNLKFEKNIPRILLDPDQMRLVFRNIIINAVEAMPKGGILEIRTEAGADFIHIMFRDTGKGIQKENIQKIFEPLFTTKASGIGLGLAIVKSIVEGHRGTIEIHSKIGEETTVIVKLPLLVAE